MSDIKPEIIEKATRLTGWDRHQYRVSNSIPRCVCGWTATESYDVEGFDRHITETVLATVADDLHAEGATQAIREAKAEAWDEGFGVGSSHGIAYQSGDDAALPQPSGLNPYRIEARDE